MPHPRIKTTVQRLGDVVVIHLKGRLRRGEGCSHLRDVVLEQADAGMIVLNLSEVERIDAWGLGVLLQLREWARSQGVAFKLMNSANQVQRLLQLTKLDRVFEFCSVRDLLCLMYRAELPAQVAVA
jgi:anti-anti-sigma factor